MLETAVFPADAYIEKNQIKKKTEKGKKKKQKEERKNYTIKSEKHTHTQNWTRGKQQETIPNLAV